MISSINIYDIILLGTHVGIVLETKSLLNSMLDMKDISITNMILGFMQTHPIDGTKNFQSHFFGKVLEKFDYFGCRSLFTQYNPSKVSLQE